MSPQGDVRPVTFNGCLGWIHAPQGPQARTAAVVIVNAVGRDARCAYRPLRLLAEQLASAGFPVLRYDHPGEGDSLDPAPGQSLFQAWVQGVGKAVQTCKTVTGQSRIVVVGWRLGGSLAALACEGVAGRFCWRRWSTAASGCAN